MCMMCVRLVPTSARTDGPSPDSQSEGGRTCALPGRYVPRLCSHFCLFSLFLCFLCVCVFVCICVLGFPFSVFVSLCVSFVSPSSHSVLRLLSLGPLLSIFRHYSFCCTRITQGARAVSLALGSNRSRGSGWCVCPARAVLLHPSVTAEALELTLLHILILSMVVSEAALCHLVHVS